MAGKTVPGWGEGCVAISHHIKPGYGLGSWYNL